MKRIAAPMIGGVVTSAILELLLYPAIYMLWRRRHLPSPNGPETRDATPEASTVRGRRRRFPWVTVVLLAIGAGAGAVWFAESAKPPPSDRGAAGLGPPFATRTTGQLTVNFYSPGGGLSLEENPVVLEFLDAASGTALDVGNVKFALDMNMPGMVMHSSASISPAGGTGRYLARINPDMAGDWTAKLSYDGPRGPGDISFTVNVKP
jgi:hypothetical protein